MCRFGSGCSIAMMLMALCFVRTASGAGIPVEAVKTSGVSAEGMVPVDLTAVGSLALGGTDLGKGIILDGAGVPQGKVFVGNVPFHCAAKGVDVSTSMRGIREPFKVVNDYLDDKLVEANGRIVVRVPAAHYTALHLLAFSRSGKDYAPRFTARLGVFGSGKGMLTDARIAVPDVAQGGSAPHVTARIPVKLAGGQEGYIYCLNVPLAHSGQLWELPGSRAVRSKKDDDQLALEFTRDVVTHVSVPDPNEFTEVPAGRQSGVILLAATLEKSPVAPSCRTIEPGNVFYENQKPTLSVGLSNSTARELKCRVAAQCSGPGLPGETTVERKTWTASSPEVKIAAGREIQVAVDVTPSPQRRGWYECRLAVEADGRVVQTRETSFAVLAPDTRKAYDDASPFGVWEFFGTHATFMDGTAVQRICELIKRGGWRWIYGGVPIAGDGKRKGKEEDGANADLFRQVREKYGIRMNMSVLGHSYMTGTGWFDEAEFQAGVVPKMREHKENLFDYSFKVMHESRSSTALICRYNEFLGGAPYAMPSSEVARVDAQFENVKKYCAAIKKADPLAKVLLFNDYPPVVIEYMKRGFPRELVDIFGLEGANFLREPERQPDWMSLLGEAETLRLAMKKYGYEDKKLYTTEALYHSTLPGNLTEHKQAVIYVREAMLAFANGFSRLCAAGMLKDPTSDYHWSNWGGAGFCHREPELNPKPGYSMMAWLTQVLDLAKFHGNVAAPNTSLHVLDFVAPDGRHVYPLWVVRGRQDVELETAVGGLPVVYDCFGNALPAAADGGTLRVAVLDAPIYVTGTTVIRVRRADPAELPGPESATLLEFDRADQFSVVEENSSALEGNWDYPRLKGAFETSFETLGGVTVMKVTLKPDADQRKLLQRYVEYKLAKPIPLNGRPEQLTARVKADGTWARVMVEMTDARGRVWTSCGNQFTGNAGDVNGDTYASAAGWQTLTINMPGQYAGSDQLVAWPFNRNWWPDKAPEYEAEKLAFDKKMEEFEQRLKDYEEEKNGGTGEAEAKKSKPEPAAAKKKKGAAGKGKQPAAAKKKGPPTPPKFRFTGIAAVDYPVQITKVIVAMSPEILYVNRRRAVPEPVIYLDKIGLRQAEDDR